VDKLNGAEPTEMSKEEGDIDEGDYEMTTWTEAPSTVSSTTKATTKLTTPAMTSTTTTVKHKPKGEANIHFTYICYFTLYYFLYCYFFLPNKKIFLACFYLLLLVIS
jgi:hypothetical protein